MGACVLSLVYFLHNANSAVAQQEQLYESPAIGYDNAGQNDAVAHLQQRLDRGEVRLEYSETDGYLGSVLKLLRVPVSSQGLVFSKTSFQLFRISPKNPRAIYFNDDVYVGFVRGGDFVELSTADPKLGGVFYMLEQTKTDKPRFVRNNECLQCHASGTTRNVPGHIVRSVFPDERGYPIAQLGSRVIGHTNPLKERWGGWFVTGTHGKEQHLGNQLFSERDHLEKLDLTLGANVTNLEKKVNLVGYPSAHSDIVALMVLEHQTQMHNLLTRLQYETKLALHHNAAMNEALQRPKDEVSDSTKRRINNAADEVLKYLLFVEETKLTAPIAGTSKFTSDFSAQGVKDKQGRSLRDFDLQQRMFRYPCSYLIYSEAFDALPPLALEVLYRKLWLVLTGQAQGKEFAGISLADRKAVLEILRSTKKNLPAYFRE
ncbi:MAG: hypothetical protein JNM09_04425 [Blastocatellia bacterium]|nr:hypothetical protein [Blastocatellia bacterium]